VTVKRSAPLFFRHTISTTAVTFLAQNKLSPYRAMSARLRIGKLLSSESVFVLLTLKQTLLQLANVCLPYFVLSRTHSVSLLLISFLFSFLFFPPIDCYFHFFLPYLRLYIIRLQFYYFPLITYVQAFFFSLILLLMHITWPFPIHSPPIVHSCEQQDVCNVNLLLTCRPSCWEYVTFHIVRSIAAIFILNPTRNTP